MGAWSRSWAITKTSFDLIGKDTEMLLFPILAGIFSLLFSVALIVPTFVLDVAREAGASEAAVGPLQIAVLFVTYFGLAFIATFFNVCVVYTTRVRLSGGDATFWDSLKFALSRTHLIAAWSLLSASVGLLLRALDVLADQKGLLFRIVFGLLRMLIATAWSVMTIFVVPAMVYKGLGPFDAIRDSLDTLKRTWGENIVRSFGMGLVSFVCALPCIGLLFGGLALAQSMAVVGLVMAGLGFLGLLVVSLVFGVARTVFNTVLYHWAAEGVVAPGFDQDTLTGAFRPR